MVAEVVFLFEYLEWCSGAVVQWCSGAVVQWCSGASKEDYENC